MDELVQWLEVQLNWDAAVARCACHLDKGQWRQDDPQRYQGRIVDDRGEMVVKDEGMLSEQRARHIAAHNPARVLREIDAKRQLLVVHRPVRRTDFLGSDGAPVGALVVCHECDANTTDADWPDMPCATLCLLALPYSDRPGYRPEWRP